MFTTHVEGKTVKVELWNQELYAPVFPWVYDRLHRKWKESTARRSEDEDGDFVWKKEVDPEWYKKRRKKERFMQKSDKSYIDNECEAWRAYRWDKRLNGEWVFLNDKPVYITGLHYYYMHLFTGTDRFDGMPGYWDTDRRFFYFMQFALDDVNTLGVALYTKRRGGKTGKSIAFMLEGITRMVGAKGGIQSKTEEDAKMVVFDPIIDAFNSLPHYWKPETTDIQKNKRPAKRLSFNSTVTGESDFEDEDERLNSSIDWRSGVEMAYDGWKMKRYIGDEFLKSERVDEIERHQVTMRSCMDYSMEFTGKMFKASTCEEIGKTKNSIKDFISFYEASNPKKRNEVTGKTKYGVIACFVPADELMGFDKFGMPDIEMNRKIILAEREDFRDNIKELYSLIRKNPLTDKEFFRVVGTHCHFDAPTIYDHIDTLSWSGGNLLSRVSLEWDGPRPGFDRQMNFNRGGRVKIIASSSGNFLIDNTSTPDMADLNRVKWIAQNPAPMDTQNRIVGVDPVDHNSTGGAGSKMCAYGAKRRLSLPVKFFIEYYGRPKMISHGYEDLLKLLFLLGCKASVENNRPGFGRYAEQRGFQNYLIYVKGSAEPGFPASTRAKDSIVDLLFDLIMESISDVPFIDLCQDWADLDITDTRKYDRAMASGWTVYGDAHLRRQRARSGGNAGAKDYFRKYKTKRQWVH